MASSRRGRLVAIIIALAVVALFTSLWVNEGPMWRLVMLEKKPMESGLVRGSHSVLRWRNSYDEVLHGHLVVWYLSNGMMSVDAYFKRNRIHRFTSWYPDGRVEMQMRGGLDLSWLDRDDLSEDYKKTSPPWWWQVADQTEPSAPWWDHESDQAPPLKDEGDGH